LTEGTADLNILLTDSEETSILWQLVTESVGVYRHGDFKLLTLRNLSAPVSESSEMALSLDDSCFWAKARENFVITRDSTDREERDQRAHDEDVKHFKGEVLESDEGFDLFKANLELMLDGDVEMREYFGSICKLVFLNPMGRNSFRKVFFQSWRESRMVSQSQQSPTTVRASEDDKVETNLVYLIGNRDAGACVTINLQRNTQKRKQSEAQVFASATTFLHTIYESWHKANSKFSALIPPYIKHYGLTFVGENYWAIFETVPDVDSQGNWLGCTTRQIGHGGYDTYEDYFRLVRRINQIHWWGLKEFAEGILKSGAVVDNSITKASQLDTSASSSSDARRSGTSATRRTASSEGTSAIEETGMMIPRYSLILC
jgi:hypothetical protein